MDAGLGAIVISSPVAQLHPFRALVASFIRAGQLHESAEPDRGEQGSAGETGGAVVHRLVRVAERWHAAERPDDARPHQAASRAFSTSETATRSSKGTKARSSSFRSRVIIHAVTVRSTLA